MFQSTRPRGARRTWRIFILGGQMFQSTRPRGARHIHALHLTLDQIVSIHAPARGATPWR